MQIRTGAEHLQTPWLSTIKPRLHTRDRTGTLLEGLEFDFFPDDDRVVSDILDVFTKHRTDINYVRAYRSGSRFDQTELGVPADAKGILDICRANSAMLNVCMLQKEIPYIGELAAMIAGALCTNVRIDAFCAAERSAATPIHYDFDNAFVAQLIGSKTWSCYDNLSEVQFHFGGYRVGPETIGAKQFRKVLTKGSGIFIPGGTLHEAFTTEDVSIHLAIDLDPILPGRVMASWLQGKLSAADGEGEGYSQFDCLAAEALKHRSINEIGSGGEAALTEAHRHYLMWTMSGYKRVEFQKQSFPSRLTRFRIAPGTLLRAAVEDAALRIEYSTYSPAAMQSHSWSYRPATASFPSAVEPIFRRMCDSGEFSLEEVDSMLPVASTDVLINALGTMGIVGFAPKCNQNSELQAEIEDIV